MPKLRGDASVAATASTPLPRKVGGVLSCESDNRCVLHTPQMTGPKTTRHIQVEPAMNDASYCARGNTRAWPPPDCQLCAARAEDTKLREREPTGSGTPNMGTSKEHGAHTVSRP